MEYMKLIDFTKVDAYILQAPTSDRETASLLMSPNSYRLSLGHAKDEITRGNENAIMPRELVPCIVESPVSVYRWHSLIAKGYVDHKEHT